MPAITHILILFSSAEEVMTPIAATPGGVLELL
jgi:hypothetical protein